MKTSSKVMLAVGALALALWLLPESNSPSVSTTNPASTYPHAVDDTAHRYGLFQCSHESFRTDYSMPDSMNPCSLIQMFDNRGECASMLNAMGGPHPQGGPNPTTGMQAVLVCLEKTVPAWHDSSNNYPSSALPSSHTPVSPSSSSHAPTSDPETWPTIGYGPGISRLDLEERRHREVQEYKEKVRRGDPDAGSLEEFKRKIVVKYGTYGD